MGHMSLFLALEHITNGVYHRHQGEAGGEEGTRGRSSGDRKIRNGRRRRQRAGRRGWRGILMAG
jgi:hypothetical protein